MKIQWTNMNGFGLSAWNHGNDPMELPNMVHHYDPESEPLILHPHEKSTLKNQKHHYHMLHKHPKK